MHIINKKVSENQVKKGKVVPSILDKLLEWLGLPILQPVPIKIFKEGQRQMNHYDFAYRHMEL